VASLLDIFAFASVLLRGLTLAFEALTVGGVFFLFAVLRDAKYDRSGARLRRFLLIFSICLAVTQTAFVAANAAILMNSTGLAWSEVLGANFCLASGLIAGGAALVGGFLRSRHAKVACAMGCALILSGSIMTSHANARLEHRGLLLFLTLAHHGAAAAWIGALPYLLLTLKETPSSEIAALITSRFSRAATISVAMVTGAGAAMAFFYVRNPSALTGTAYGIMLTTKVALTGTVLLLGGLNLKIIRAVRSGGHVTLLPLRRFGEAELGIGFTIILAAASLTSTPPAIDVDRDRVSASEIVQRIRPVWPRMETPALADLSPVTPLAAPTLSAPGSFVPGQVIHPSTLADIAWSEYNHHWAGLLVLAAGLLSLLARRLAWARHWPVVFFGLAVFLFLRADAENWPLGPRGFWESFKVAEVAQHRLFLPLIIMFGVFEWAVQTGRLREMRSALVFPSVCAVGGMLLLTHSHSLGNVKEEFLAELSHAAIAICAVLAGWSRWLEIRLSNHGSRRVATWIWPICFILIGGLLLNYREA
jgi:copper resistance protein D